MTSKRHVPRRWIAGATLAAVLSAQAPPAWSRDGSQLATLVAAIEAQFAAENRWLERFHPGIAPYLPDPALTPAMRDAAGCMIEEQTARDPDALPALLADARARAGSGGRSVLGPALSGTAGAWRSRNRFTRLRAECGLVDLRGAQLQTRGITGYVMRNP